VVGHGNGARDHRDRKPTQAEVIAESNGLSTKENLIAQPKNGFRALHAPLNTLEVNGRGRRVGSGWTG
jgi:hypothetical protein